MSNESSKFAELLNTPSPATATISETSLDKLPHTAVDEAQDMIARPRMWVNAIDQASGTVTVTGTQTASPSDWAWVDLYQERKRIRRHGYSLRSPWAAFEYEAPQLKLKEEKEGELDLDPAWGEVCY